MSHNLAPSPKLCLPAPMHWSLISYPEASVSKQRLLRPLPSEAI